MRVQKYAGLYAYPYASSTRNYARAACSGILRRRHLESSAAVQRAPPVSLVERERDRLRQKEPEAVHFT